MEVKPSNPKDIVGSNKVALHYLPLQVLMEVSLGLTEGGMKYGAHNYRAVGVRSSVYFDATMRHLFAWFEGQDIDADSGLSHVTKAISSLMVLRDAMLNDMCTDDRPIRVKNLEFIKEYNEVCKKLIEKYPNPVPPYTHEKLDKFGA